MEESTFKDARVRAAFTGFVELALYADERNDALKARTAELQQKLVGNRQLPAYVIVNSRNGSVLAKFGFKLAFVTDPATFVVELEKALAAFAAAKN
ncbi:MAG: hypothetical protein EXS14_06935 [Planctomycetes bacterium]|nr:hypothetical protein [Planctomycetota bacterium]